MFQNLFLVFCVLCFAQNPFLQDACFKYSAQIICFLNWTAFLYKFAYARGRAAREAEHAAREAEHAAETAEFTDRITQYVRDLKVSHEEEIAEFTSCMTQLEQHCQNVSNNFEAVVAASANGCKVVWRGR